MRNILFTSPRSLSLLYVGFLDFLAISAIYFTGELHASLFFPILVINGILLALKLEFADWFLMAILILLLFTAPGLIYYTKIGAVLVIAYLAPIFHSFLWLAKDREKYLSWRIGLGFMEITLAAAVTPELYLFLFVFLFIVLSSLAISVMFLDHSLSTLAPELRNKKLPIGFLKNSFYLAIFLLLSSALLFPILPRSSFSFRSLAGIDLGYTEEVNVGDWKQLSSRGQEKIVLRFFLPNNLIGDRRFSLIRGKVLEHFNGITWTSGVKSTVPYSSINTSKENYLIEVIREPMNSNILPLPYGAKNIQMVQKPWIKPSYILSGEWQDQSSLGRRTQYSFNFPAIGEKLMTENIKADLPRPIHLSVPWKSDNKKIQNYAKSLLGKVEGNEKKIEKIKKLFFTGGFSPLLPTGAVGEKKESPIEDFLFKSKKGHCELFASSAAILLRFGGVPTRLVSGFRLSQAPTGSVVIVKNTEAHAWLEAWIPGKGWQALDPTPAIAIEPSPMELLSLFYDELSSYWYKYVVSFDSDTQRSYLYEAKSWFRASKTSDHDSMLTPADPFFQKIKVVFKKHFLSLFVVLILLSISVGFLIFYKKISFQSKKNDLIRKRIYLLNKELLHWDNFYMKLLPEQKNALVPYLNRWENRYNFLRFASHEPITDEILLELKQIQYDAGIYLSDNFRSKRNSVG